MWTSPNIRRFIWWPSQKTQTETKANISGSFRGGNILIIPTIKTIQDNDIFPRCGLVPKIKQYQIVLMDVFFTPVTKSYESLSRFLMKPSLTKDTIVNIGVRQNSKPIIEYMIADGIIKLKAVVNSKYSQSIKLKALNGINMIRRATKIIEDNKMSFDFEEDRIEWLGVTNRPPIGEPEEEEREKDFNAPSISL